MYRRTIILIAIALLALTPVLSGCSTKVGSDASGRSLMERFHSGEDLIGEDSDEPAVQARHHLNRGVNYLAQGRSELAYEQFTRAAALDPDLAEARYQRGEILLERGMNDQALTEFQQVAESLPDYAPVHEAIGLVYFRSNLYPEALQYLSKAVTLDPRSVRALTHIGAIHNYNKDYDKAILAFRAALATEPTNGTIYNNMGLTYSMMGSDENAVEAFRTALRMGAPSSKAYNNMGLALARLGRHAEALEAFRCAEGEAAAYNNLGYVYFMDGQYAQAIASYERAIELEPTYYHRAHENLKRARLALRFEESEKGSTPALFSGSIPQLDAPGVTASVPAGPLAEASGTGNGPALMEVNPEPGVPSGRSADWLYKHPRIPASAPAPKFTPKAQVSTVSATASASVSNTSAALAQAEPTVARKKIRKVPEKLAAPPVVNDPIYTLHYSSWRSRHQALRQAARLQAQGHEAHVLAVTLPGKGDWYRVTIGAYSGLEEAREALSNYKKDKKFNDLRIVRRSRHMRDDGSRNM